MSDFIRKLKDMRHSLFYGALLRRVPLITLGHRQNLCAWTLCPDGLDERSIVYSGGIGRDVTFEHGLVKQFGCTVTLFDPSPTGSETMSLSENKIPHFKFRPVGLAGSCSTLRFAPPLRGVEGSWYIQSEAAATIELPCVDLHTLMGQNGDRRIDLLKIDIEGAEYDVIDDMLRRRVPVRQVLVEFHHRNLPHIRRSQTIRAIIKLVAAGYRLINRTGDDHTFLNPRM